MRITTGQLFESNRRNVQANFAEMAKWQEQLASGKRMEILSDDAPQSALLLRQKGIRSAIEQYDRNLRNATGYLGQSEVALTEIQSIMNKGYEIAIQGATSSLDQAARLSLADQVTQMQQRMKDLANARGNEGQYLFGGMSNTSAPYLLSGSTLTYVGDTGDIRVETSPGQTMKVNITGGEDFTNAYAALESLKSNLIGGQPGVISGTNVGELQTQSARFSQLRAEVGVAMQQVTSLKSGNQRRMDELTEGISNIEDVDVTVAVTELSRAQTAYQAALAVSANGFSLSLMDYLR